MTPGTRVRVNGRGGGHRITDLGVTLMMGETGTVISATNDLVQVRMDGPRYHEARVRQGGWHDGLFEYRFDQIEPFPAGTSVLLHNTTDFGDYGCGTAGVVWPRPGTVEESADSDGIYRVRCVPGTGDGTVLFSVPGVMLGAADDPTETHPRRTDWLPERIDPRWVPFIRAAMADRTPDPGPQQWIAADGTLTQGTYCCGTLGTAVHVSGVNAPVAQVRLPVAAGTLVLAGRFYPDARERHEVTLARVSNGNVDSDGDLHMVPVAGWRRPDGRHDGVTSIYGYAGWWVPISELVLADPMGTGVEPGTVPGSTPVEEAPAAQVSDFAPGTRVRVLPDARWRSFEGSLRTFDPPMDTDVDFEVRASESTIPGNVSVKDPRTEQTWGVAPEYLVRVSEAPMPQPSAPEAALPADVANLNTETVRTLVREFVTEGVYRDYTTALEVFRPWFAETFAVTVDAFAGRAYQVRASVNLAESLPGVSGGTVDYSVPLNSRMVSAVDLARSTAFVRREINRMFERDGRGVRSVREISVEPSLDFATLADGNTSAPQMAEQVLTWIGARADVDGWCPEYEAFCRKVGVAPRRGGQVSGEVARTWDVEVTLRVSHHAAHSTTSSSLDDAIASEFGRDSDWEVDSLSVEAEYSTSFSVAVNSVEQPDGSEDFIEAAIRAHASDNGLGDFDDFQVGDITEA